jgi:tyrosinase
MHLHSNIDRLFAIWQGLHDDRSAKSWVTPLAAGWPNWTTEAGTIEDMNTKLYPFRPSARDKEDWYTSENTEGPNSVKRTEAFGYTYPETASLTYPVLEEPRKALFKRVSDIYPSPPREIRRSRAGISEAGAMFLPQAKVLERIEKEKVAATHSQLVQLSEKLPEPEVLLQQSLGSEKPFLKDLAPKNEYLEWLVNIKAERHSLGGNYSVHVFLNDVQEDNVALWPVSPHHVGSFMPFGQSSNTGCANCKNQRAEHLEITGQIPLTIALIERYLAGIIGDITEATVVPYLTKNLHWRVESVSYLGSSPSDKGC